jgi:hypothetical protein
MQTLTLEIPDEAFAFLCKMAAEFGAPREEIAAEWLAAAIQRAREDPLLQLAGSIESPITNGGVCHDHYIGQALADETRSGESG